MTSEPYPTEIWTEHQWDILSWGIPSGFVGQLALPIQDRSESVENPVNGFTRYCNWPGKWVEHDDNRCCFRTVAGLLQVPSR